MKQIPKLLQLARDNAAQSRPLNIVTAADADEATIYLYGVIGGWWGDIDAEAFSKEIAAIKASIIHVRINSPGGDVFDARAMMTAARAHSAKIIAHIDGLAASAATAFAMAADEVEISQGSRFMIHRAWTVSIGNQNDMREAAELLDGIDNDLATDYAIRSGQERDQIMSWMDAETWMNADEAVERGFADRVVQVVKEKEGASSASNVWNLSAYKNAPKDLLQQRPEANAHRATLERRLAFLERAA
ncbi:head maturation protease, ClpP-related [Pigmentiphaga daeguensis]|uniref:Clp protease ClpP n=1 Tax=Pigmentiphaga daeguensis TaxID=414049 RepID=A0ABN1BAK9_9BURK